MLIGEYRHTIDDKNRLSLPSKFRKELGKKVIVTRGLDRCLFIYPVKEWQKFSTKLSDLSVGNPDSRAFNRFVLGGAIETDVDGSGRILIPEFLKTFASLGMKVVVAGINNRVELWSEESWNAYATRVEGQADTLAERLGEIGMI